MQRSDMHKAVSETQRAGAEIHGAMQNQMQNSMELGAEVTRAGLNAAIKIGHTTIEASRIRLSDTPACVDRSAPTFARDQDFVLRELLGYDDARIEALTRAGVLK